MGLFEQMASSCFKQADQGKTIFHFPLLFFNPSRGYIISDQEDVGRLKENITKFHKVWVWITVPLISIFFISIYNGGNLEFFLLTAFGIGILFRLGYILFFLQRLLHGHHRTVEKISFQEAQRMQANAYSMRTFRNLGLSLVLFLGLGGFALLRGDIALGTVLLVLFLLLGLQLAHHARIKFRSVDSGSPQRFPDETNGR